MNKRQLKKQIHNLCGGLACDCVAAAAGLSNIDDEKLGSLVLASAKAQAKALKRASLSFDKTPRDFDSMKAYHKARRDYFAKAYTQLRKELIDDAKVIVTDLNGLMSTDAK